MSYHQNRLDAMKRIQAHPWLHRVWDRLTESEASSLRRFIVARAEMDHHQFELAVNRMYLDRPDDRTGHWKEIMELLSCINSDALKVSKADAATRTPQTFEQAMLNALSLTPTGDILDRMYAHYRDLLAQSFGAEVLQAEGECLAVLERLFARLTARGIR